MIQHIDAPLREDVRLLGNLLGETLKEQAGQDLFNQIEQIRALSKGARDGNIEAEKQLEQGDRLVELRAERRPGFARQVAFPAGRGH